ncbi:MAG: MBL fold metallo-hydrolase [Thermodesulfobacteriota bacterium]
MPPEPAPSPALIEITPSIFYVFGENKSRFPFCSGLYVKGRDLRLLIDAGMGPAGLALVRSMGIDALVLSHCHIDHRLTRGEILETPVWCHEAEAGYLEDKERFFTALGYYRGGFRPEYLFPVFPDGFEMKIARELADGETVDLGGLTLEVIHAPGHTPGHLAFYFPEADLLFSSDVDLTTFGPYYGHDFADLDEFIRSIRRLKDLGASIVATGHAGPFHDDLAERFQAYENIIHQRDRQVLEMLSRPRPLEYFKHRGLIYRPAPSPVELNAWFELIHVAKHLERLAYLGYVEHRDGLWFRRRSRP